MFVYVFIALGIIGLFVMVLQDPRSPGRGVSYFVSRKTRHDDATEHLVTGGSKADRRAHLAEDPDADVARGAEGEDSARLFRAIYLALLAGAIALAVLGPAQIWGMAAVFLLVIGGAIALLWHALNGP